MAEEELGTPVTLEELRRLNTAAITLPALSAKLGRPATVTVRPITRRQYFSATPVLPIPGSEDWTPEEWESKRRAWLVTQPAATRVAHRLAWDEASALIVSMAAVAPTFAVEDAQLLGEDLEDLVPAILRLSGLIEEPAEKDEATSAAAAEKGDTAASEA